MKNPVSVIVPFHRRYRLLNLALSTWPIDAGDMIELVILNNDDEEPFDRTKLYPYFASELKVVEVPTPSSDGWHAPGVLWNLGVRVARHERVIISHPEIALLPLASGQLGAFDAASRAAGLEANVLAFACRTLKVPPPYVHDAASVCRWLSDIEAATDYADFAASGVKGWYAHPTIRANLAPWFMATTKRYFREVGGFDYRYDAVYGFDDMDFALRVVNSQKARGGVAMMGDPATVQVVGHLGHDRPTLVDYGPAKALFEATHGADAVREG